MLHINKVKLKDKKLKSICFRTPGLIKLPLMFISTQTEFKQKKVFPVVEKQSEVLFISSYPPRECGIANYSHDLIRAFNSKFGNSFTLTVCALESGNSNYQYPVEVKYVLDTSDSAKFESLASTINQSPQIKIVLIQHEFGLFQNTSEEGFLHFLKSLTKPIIIGLR